MSVLHRHSTLFGLTLALLTTLAVGQMSHWTPFWMILTGMVGLFVFPRMCYGFYEARALDGPREPYHDPDPDHFTLQDLVLGKWALPAAVLLVAIVIVAGVFTEMGASALRLRTGPHGWFVISSVFGTISGPRSGHAWQNDSALEGPFEAEKQCDTALKKWHSPGYGVNYYCRDTLVSDAKAIWHGIGHDDWPNAPQ